MLPRVWIGLALLAMGTASCLEPLPPEEGVECGPGTVDVGGICVVDEGTSGQNNNTPRNGVTQPSTDTTTTEPDLEELCQAGLRASKPIGAECEKHCECDTGYCYDEAYMGDFRFCTRECGSQGCNTGITGGIEQYKCLILGSFEAEFGLEHSAICQKICTTVEDCKFLSSKYDQCGTPGAEGTLWDGITVTIEDTCQVSEGGP